MKLRIPLLLLALCAALPVRAEGDASAVKVTPLTEAPPTEISPAVETPPVYKAPHLNNRQPLLSEVSRELGERGKVVVTALIGRDGTLQDAKIAQSSGFPRLDVLALDTARGWQYEPGKRDGKPVLAKVDIPFEFGTLEPQTAKDGKDKAPNPRAAAAARGDRPELCGSSIPNVTKWLPLLTPQPSDIDYPKPVKDRAIDIGRWDPNFDFDSGNSPYLAFELPKYEGPYAIKITSTVNPKLFYPVMLFLDRQKRPTRCLTAAVDRFVPASWSNFASFVGEIPITRESRRDYYVIIFTTPEQAVSSTDPKDGYNLVSWVQDYLWSLVSKDKWNEPQQIPHDYTGMLRIETRKLGGPAEPTRVASNDSH
ncbi:MalM family protein [Chitinivorax sp. PXF-14]|uniref:MalM family protein n=1 Tax=Chitinivorax sp. PXF-14 TaxID=3230488 RepID=UPI0034670561